MRRRLLVLALLGCVIGCDAGEPPPPPLPPPPPPPSPIPVAIALVLPTQEMFVGNDEYTDKDSAWDGTLSSLKRGLDDAPPAAAFPAGSQGLVIGYSTGARVIAPLRPLERLTGAALGIQRDYQGEIGDDLAAGVVLAGAELERVNARRRIVVVLGRGDDSHPEEARQLLRATQPVRDLARIEVSAALSRLCWGIGFQDVLSAATLRVYKGAGNSEGMRLLLREIWALPSPEECKRDLEERRGGPPLFRAATVTISCRGVWQ